MASPRYTELATSSLAADKVDAQTRAIVESYRDPAPLGDGRLIVSAALIGASLMSRLPADASEKEQRADVARLLSTVPDGVRRTVASADQLFGDRASTVRDTLNEGAIKRFERFTQLAAEHATRTLEGADGKATFYSPGGIADLANAQVASEYQRSLHPAAKSTLQNR